MLAFAKDITQNKPQHPRENQDTKLKQYMDYQRKLNHSRIVYHCLRHAKKQLQEKLQSAKSDSYTLETELNQSFPISHKFAEAETLLVMLKKSTLQILWGFIYFT